MARPSWRTLKPGDLLSIPVDDNRVAVGQVIDPGQEMYFCVYQPLFPSGQEIPVLCGAGIALIARTSDELLWHGQWAVVGRQDLPADIPRPYYVVDTPYGSMLRTFQGSDVRPATDQDLAAYGRQFSISNVTFFKAMRHIHGIETYPGDFARITYDVAHKRSVLA